MTNEWKKGADNLWRYLNSSGEMAVNSWADNDYYVDANGIMVANKWMQIASPYSRDSQTYWFYFSSSGKVTNDTWKKIDGKSYYFDADGIMQTGWTEDGDYYLSSSGAMVTGWKYLEPKDEDSSLFTERKAMMESTGSIFPQAERSRARRPAMTAESIR